jgi:hypothetical protein
MSANEDLEAAARLFEDAAAELEQAAAHCRTAAGHMRAREVPRDAAHAWARSVTPTPPTSICGSRPGCTRASRIHEAGARVAAKSQFRHEAVTDT